MINKPLKMQPHGMPGRLITFCGLDGCGKSTMIKMLKEDLTKEGYDVLVTKQPTDAVRRADIFRNFMDSPDHSLYQYRALSLMAAADRVQHVNKIILPALEAGRIVLCDRYFFSCIANLRARGFCDDEWIYEVAKKEIVDPDLALFLEVPVALSLDRVQSRPEEKDRYVDVELQFRLRDEYRNIAMLNHGILISTDDVPERSFQTIHHLVKGVLK